MKVFICLMMIGNVLFAQGIEFFEGAFEDALAEARKTEKLIFVDAYAVWCGPCKKMAATTFKENIVGEYFNSRFINMKIDMEKGQGLRFRKTYPVSAYPTLLFITGDGKVVHKVTGAKKADELIKIGELALQKDDRSENYAKQYEAGNRDYELVLNYVKALNKVGKPSLKISNDYLRSNPPMTKEQKAAFLFEAAIYADSRLFDQMIDHRATLEKMKGKEIIIAQIEKACCKTVDKAIEYESKELLNRAKEKMKKNAKSVYKSFDITSDMDYFEGVGQIDQYLARSEDYTRKVINDDPVKLMEQGQHLAKHYQSNSKAIELIQKSYERSLDLSDSVDGRMSYATLLHSLEKTDKAINQAKLAKIMTENEGKSTTKVDRLIKFLESK